MDKTKLDQLVEMAEKLVMCKYYGEVKALAWQILMTGKIPTEYAKHVPALDKETHDEV